MRVVHIIAGLGDGGAEGVLTRLCIHSKRATHVVISLMGSGKYGAQLTEAGVSVYCLGMNPGNISVPKFFKLVRWIKAEKPDVVQTWMYHADLLGGIAARLAGVKRVFWGIRMSSLEKGKSTGLTIRIAQLCALLSKWIPEKIVCCAQQARWVHSIIGYQKSKLVVIPNGYELQRFKPDSVAGFAVRNELGLRADEFVIGNVGRFDPLKGHLNLLRALVLAAEHVKFRCVLVGKGLSPDNHTLMNWIAALGLKDKVLLAGQRSDVPAVMNALDLHVLSSSSEGFPNVLAEAMACGTACISTDVGDAREILGNENLTCPANNPQDLADLIVEMAREWQQDPKHWHARKVGSVKRISDRFSIAGMVNAYEDCWLGQNRSMT